MISEPYFVIYHLFQTNGLKLEKRQADVTFSQSVSILFNFDHPRFIAAS